MNNDIAKVLGLEDVIVNNVEEKDRCLIIDIELPRKHHYCPCCHSITDKIHDYRIQMVKDLSAFGKQVVLKLRKRRYVCPKCGKRFYEENDFLPKYHRLTQRKFLCILNAFSKLKPASMIAEENDISSTTALRYFDILSYGTHKLPEILSIDEFKGNADGEKYQTILTDPENKIIVDILPNRFEKDLIHYFLEAENRDDVKVFITDMNPHFKRVAEFCFPNAVIVADRFHVVRQVIWAMENVRKSEQKRLSVHFRRYFKRSKKLLNKPMNALNDEEKERLALMFSISPKLAAAYRLKNAFLKIIRMDSSEKAKSAFSNWLFDAENAGLSEFKSCITAYRNWYSEILNAIDFKWNNGFTEGCNNKTKVLKRICFGIRNFNRFKNRIMHCSA